MEEEEESMSSKGFLTINGETPQWIREKNALGQDACLYREQAKLKNEDYPHELTAA
jgi:hypothetical protein